jgi:hypothetical protein
VRERLIKSIAEVFHLRARQAVIDLLRDVSLKIFGNVGAADIEILAELEDAKDSVL